MKKKTWSRKNIVTDVGPCKYCNVMISNTDSFVALVKELNPISYNYAHYQCMREDDDLKQKVLNSVEQQLKEEKKFDW